MDEKSGLEALVKELSYLRVAVSSLNPDPQETTRQYRRRQQRLLMIAVMSVSASVSAMVLSLFALLRNCQ
jgi:hypothetical protein